MRPLAPLTASLLAAFLAVPALAQVDTGKLKPPVADTGKAAPPKKVFKADAAQAAILAPEKFEAKEDRTVVYTGDAKPLVLDKDLLEKADMEVADDGKLVYKSHTIPTGAVPVEDKVLVPVLKGLIPFARAKALSPADVGKKLREWGVPAQFNGRHLMNPDGTATYYGVMLYQGIGGDKTLLPKVSGERLAASLALFESAFDQAFSKNAADVGGKDLERAWGMLKGVGSKGGETPLKLMDGAAYVTPAKWKADLTAAKGDAKAIAALNALEKTRYHKDKDLNTAPPPAPGDPPNKGTPPSILSLHGVLAALDKLNGKKLTAAQQEWLVKSFPMGETIWRMAAPKLWREGLTGQGVKVAVIDTGVGYHPDLDPQVKGREDFTRERGGAQFGDHATHVAGTILALAPNAEIRSYRVVKEGSYKENPRLAQEGDEAQKALSDAIDKAVADGNMVINMSLSGPGRPSGPLAEKIRAYAKKGVVFVIGAGNEGGHGPTGVGAPGNTPGVLTVGSVDVNDRYSRFSSFGSVWDPANVSYWTKRVVMAPGQDINSSWLSGAPGHQVMSGTSMATPHVAGAATLLTQYALGKYKDPAARGSEVRDALSLKGKWMSARDLPPDAPPDQDFLLVDPEAAYKRLRDGAAARPMAK